VRLVYFAPGFEYDEAHEEVPMKRQAKLVFGLALFILLADTLRAQTACFSAAEFTERRQALLSEVGDGVVMIDAALFPSEFLYLTGVQSRAAKLILIPEGIAAKTPKPQVWLTTLYLPPKSPQAGTWDDPVLSAGDDTLTPTGIRNNAPLSDFWSDVVKVGLITDAVYIPFRANATDPERLPDDVKFVDQVRRVLPQVRVKNLLPALGRRRWTKTPAEIEVMRRACAIVTEAFREAARITRPGLYEYEVEAAINYVFRRLGSERPAFLIIGSGPNSCILHHMKNDRLMGEDELLLIDVGNVYCGLSDDLTRTIPATGKFTAEQKKIYEIVLKAQKAALAVVKPGVTLAQVHETARKVIADAGYGKYFIHGTSHTLNGGISANPLHLGTWRPELPPDRYAADDVPVEPGTMFTIEPGIYIPEKNLGIRIEDSVLVTADGCEVLTAAAPKEIAEVERLMKEEPAYLKK
jgi:Xaa-Pro aminopeptidase